MSAVNIKGVMQCPRCQARFPIHSRPVLDPQGQPDDYAAFLRDELNPKKCPACAVEIAFPTPTTIVGPYWVGVALENPEPILAPKVYEILQVMVPAEVRAVASPSRPILVVGRAHELRRLLENKPGERFCCGRLDTMGFVDGNRCLSMVNWEEGVELLSAIVDAYLENGAAALAYWQVSEMVNSFNGLYLHPRIQELLELTALAAGDQMPANLIQPRTARADLDLLHERFKNVRKPQPAWWQASYFCFYEHGQPRWPNPNLGVYETVVQLMAFKPDGHFDLARAERHMVAGPVQAVAVEELHPRDRAILYVIILLMTGNLRQAIPQAPADILWVERQAGSFFHREWDKLVPADRDQVAEAYRQLRGRDLRADFKLEDPQAADDANAMFFDLLDSFYLDMADDSLKRLESTGELTRAQAAGVRLGQLFLKLAHFYALDCIGCLPADAQPEVATLMSRFPSAESHNVRHLLPFMLQQQPISLEKEIREGWQPFAEARQTMGMAFEPAGFARTFVKNKLRPKIVEVVRRMVSENSSKEK